MSREFTGWLLDLFDDAQDGVVLWFLATDGTRLRLHQPFPVTFAATASPERLRSARSRATHPTQRYIGSLR